MERRHRVVILGGGMAGIGAAYTLRLSQRVDVVLVERERELGGLAGSFEQGGAFYPLGYHHILRTDEPLLFFLGVAGSRQDVRWRKVRLLFWYGDGLHELGSPTGLLGFPLPPRAKAGLLTLGAYAFTKRRWTAWHGRSAAELVDAWGGRALRERFFEPLAQLKFGRSCREVSAAWLGARLHAREGATRLGYIPGTNWTKVLCDGLTRELERLGCDLRTRVTARRLRHRARRVTAVELDSGEVLEADTVISAVPTVAHRRLLPEDETPELAQIRYTALFSMVCATRMPISPDFYWLTLSKLDRTAGAIFNLTSLNPSIGLPGETCINFVTHLPGAGDERFGRSEDALMEEYVADAERVLGVALEPTWRHLSRISHYSPVFGPDYQNPPLRSFSFDNLYYAGNHCTYPSVASTGTALASGIEAAAAVLAARGVRDQHPDVLRLAHPGRRLDP